MKKKLFPMLLLPLLLAAEDFEAYPDAAALRRVWLEFDAGNPAPESVGFGTLNGKAMQVTAARDYSLLYREMENPLGAKAAGIRLAVKGDASNPADAVLTVAVRAGKGGADDERGEAVDIAAADQNHQQRPRRSDGRTCGQEAVRDDRAHAALPARAQRDERCHRRQQVRNEQIRDKDGRIGLRVPHRSRERDQVPREPEREAKIGHGGQMRVDAPQKLLGARGCRRGFRSVCLLHIRFPLKTLRIAL